MDRTKKYVIQFIILAFILIGIVTVYNMNANSTKTITKSEDVSETVVVDSQPKDNDEKDNQEHKPSQALQPKKKENSSETQKKPTDKKVNQQTNQEIDQHYVQVSILDDKGSLVNEKIKYKDGMTAYQALKLLCTQKGFSLKITGNDFTAYVKSINGLAERDYGGMSGWKYKVNGAYPSVGSGQYKLKENDRVEWIYDKAQ